MADRNDPRNDQGKATRMADDPNTTPLFEVSWLRLFPWLRLFRAPGAAADPKKLFLAAIGLLLMSGGWQVLDRAFPASSGITPDVFEARELIGPDTLLSIPWWMIEPARLIMAPFFAAMDEPSDLGGGAFVHAVLAAFWSVLVWGLIGGAISRVAVVGLVQGERVGVRNALRFAVRKAVPLVGAPLIPVLGIVMITTLLAGFGLLYRLPGGSVVAGVLALLPLIGGLLLTLMVIGLAVGWPMMPASVACQAEDGFDALSRSYAYLRQRPWNLLGYGALAFLIGAAGLIFVDVFARLVVHLSAWGLSFGAPSKLVSALYHGAEPDVSPTVLQTHSFWIGIVAILVRSWIYSFFWTSASLIYLLLRKDVDGTPLTKIAIDENVNKASGGGNSVSSTSAGVVVTEVKEIGRDD